MTLDRGGRRWLPVIMPLLAALGFTVASCGTFSTATSHPDKRLSAEETNALQERVGSWRSRAEPGEPIGTMDELLDVEFDTVHIFAEGAEGREIREIAGTSPYADDQFHMTKGNLLMFTSGGELVRWGVTAQDDFIGYSHTSWPATAKVVGESPGPGIELVKG